MNEVIGRVCSGPSTMWNDADGEDEDEEEEGKEEEERVSDEDDEKVEAVRRLPVNPVGVAVANVRV